MKAVKYIAGLLLLLVIALVVFGQMARSHLQEDQPQMFSEPVFDNTSPALPESFGASDDALGVLVFSKTNGFRHHEAIAAANRLFGELANQRGWEIFQTENGAVFSAELLQRFDVVVWSNATGPALTDSQQAAFKAFIENGGGYVGIHSAGDGSHAGWPWYQQEIVRASFTGHALLPQFQTGTVTTEDGTHPAMLHFGNTWDHYEEWYCFEESPRQRVNVLASLDETGMNMWSVDHRQGIKVRNLAMGEDHPVIWSHNVGEGRVFYTALGHAGATFELTAIRTMLAEAISWAGKRDSIAE